MNRTVIGETLRRHFTSVAFGGYLALLGIIGLITGVTRNAGGFWPTMVWLLALICGSRLIGPEFSTGTLQLILVKPVNRSVYVVSRVAGVFIAVSSGAAIAFVCEAVMRLIRAGEAPWMMMLQSLAATLLIALLACTLLALFGSLTRSYVNIAIYIGIYVAFNLSIFALGMKAVDPAIVKAVNTAIMNLYPDRPPRLDRGWVLMVTANAALALLASCAAFSRREVPYGAD